MNYYLSKSNAIIVFIFTTFVFTSCKPKAEIQFLSKEIQIGNIKAGETKQIVTEIKNIGSDTLIIDNISAGCNCTKVNLDLKKIPPGEKTNVNFTYHASIILKPKDPINVAIVVRSNTENKFDELYLKGTIK